MRIKRRKKKDKDIDLIFVLFIVAGLALLFQRYPERKQQIAVFCVAAVLVAIMLYILFRYIKKLSLLHSPLSKIDRMDGVEFENFCIACFQRRGYSAKPTDITGDYGADILLKKDGKKTVVQCKRYKGSVGISAVQEAIGAIGYYKADKAMVVTNSYFTPNAVNLAKANDVELWDRNRLRCEFKL
ncbi:MAG: restriction endonuclease [Lachnospiraceae bacterium]|nr:restriction endonuclease [Lachnospiraceae bacterium]